METCLRKSIEQYRRIIDHAEQLEELLSKSDPEALQRYTARMQELQDEATQNDRLLHELMSRKADDLQNHPLVRQRTELLKQIVSLNHLLLPRIHGMMAMTAHELSQIKGGRVAMAGYRQPVARSYKVARGVG